MKPTVEELLRTAMEARKAILALPRTEWNSSRALMTRGNARIATRALAEAAGYTLGDAAHLVQSLTEDAYRMPAEVEARINKADEERAERGTLVITVTVTGYEPERDGTPEDVARNVRSVVETNTDLGADAEPGLTREELERILGDFAAEVSMDLDRDLSGYGEGTVKVARRLAERVGLEWK